MSTSTQFFPFWMRSNDFSSSWQQKVIQCEGPVLQRPSILTENENDYHGGHISFRIWST